MTSSSNDLEEFFKIIVRMGKENPMGNELGYENENLLAIDQDMIKTPKIKYWKDKAFRINKLFEELGLENITELMKNVSFYFIPSCKLLIDN